MCLQGADYPTFPLFNGVLSLFQLLIWNLGRRLKNKRKHINHLIHSYCPAEVHHQLRGSVFLPRLPLRGRTTRECRGDEGLLLRRYGIQDRRPAFWRASPWLDMLFGQHRKGWVNMETSAWHHFIKEENWLVSHFFAGQCMKEPKILTLQFVMFRIRGKSPVREKLREADAWILRLVHHIVPDSLHQSVHKL